MKKLAGFTAILLTAASVLPTGCRGGSAAQTDSAGKPVYGNIRFSDDYIAEQPDGKVYTFEMTEHPCLTMQALYDLFDQKVEYFYPDVFTAEQKKLLYNVNGKDGEGEDADWLPQTEYDADGNPTVGGFERNKEKLFSGDCPTPWLWFNCDRGCIQMLPNGSLQSVTCDAAFQINNAGSKTVAMYCAADANTVTDRIPVPQSGFQSSMTRHLLDRDFPLTDAIEKTKQLVNEADRETANPQFVPDVTEAWVVDMGNGVYGYHLWLTSVFNGIRIDTSPMKQGIGLNHEQPDGNTQAKIRLPGYAFMMESERLDSIMAYGYLRACEISNVQEQQTVISYDEALQKLSEAVSGWSDLLISRADFVYTPHYAETECSGNADSAWKFLVQNQNDGYDYVFYVHSQTGKVEYYKYW